MSIHGMHRQNRQDKTQEVRVFNSIVRMLGTTLNVYAYIVDGMLIDSGPHRLQKGIMDFCRQNRPDKIVHTHFHEDHTGNTAYLVKKLQIPAYIHPESLSICRYKGDIPLYRLAFWGPRIGFQAKPLPDFIENEHSRFEVIKTPGHTTDHVVFLEREKGRLFSGDLFLHHKTRVVRRKENIPLLMESLRSLLKENFDTIYCAHGGKIENGYHLIEQKLAYLEELQGQILTLFQKGLSIKEISKEIFPLTPTIAYFSLGEFSSYNLVRSLIEDRM
ncbi:MBL fold metallo-hydrolase [Desulfosporosinus youngiae]|uniref:Zn-dependent hydrolase, glyoxylase n=1 Tax=Desulfosporosinus youngiae DSM 17734 TaxID=768710 RepID=H5XTU8_9FIRM|nr:MBL fold metallo-hydrolase [Desulfosporosinus youngiae]EHQ88831.1 Zn-dependent hydrolase, glyoxylase [Desulfosporosinus youngiae DSM 17734]